LSIEYRVRMSELDTQYSIPDTSFFTELRYRYGLRHRYRLPFTCRGLDIASDEFLLTSFYTIALHVDFLIKIYLVKAFWPTFDNIFSLTPKRRSLLAVGAETVL
jgi:hypothetical protein